MNTRPQLRAQVYIVFNAIFLVTVMTFSGGCSSYSHEYRVQQVVIVGDSAKVVVAEGITEKSSWTSARVFDRRRFTLLTFKLSDQICPPTAANEILDASVGLPPLDQRDHMATLRDSMADLAGPRVDFLMGADPDRVTRVLRNVTLGIVKQRVAVLGHDRKSGKWSVLRSWELNAPLAQSVYASSLDGHFAILPRPDKVLDTRTLEEISAADIPNLIQKQYADVMHWQDWGIRDVEARGGLMASSEIISSGNYGADWYVWDAVRHEPLKWSGGRPACWGLYIAEQRDGSAVKLHVLDIATAMGSRKAVRAVDGINSLGKMKLTGG